MHLHLTRSPAELSVLEACDLILLAVRLHSTNLIDYFDACRALQAYVSSGM